MTDDPPKSKHYAVYMRTLADGTKLKIDKILADFMEEQAAGTIKRLLDAEEKAHMEGK